MNDLGKGSIVMMSDGMPAGYFEQMYAQDDDPWGFESAWYERRKQALTLALLPAARYKRAFEPGCASGEITRRLADRCDEVIGLEPVERIAARARSRLADLANVQILTGALPVDWPPGIFDLILLSEVVYYLCDGQVAAVASLVRASLSLGGHLVCVHYLGETNYPQSGHGAHEAIKRLLPELELSAAYQERAFEALVLQR